MPVITKSLVRTFYDLQHDRIQTGNRICAEIKARLGQQPGMSEEQLKKESKDYLDRARAECSRITDAFVDNKAHRYLEADFKDREIITDAGMLIFVEYYEKQLAEEEHMGKVIAKLIEQEPLWGAFLEGVKGCGPLMSAVILAEFDIHKAERISQMWKYAGLDVAADGRGRGRYPEHLVDQVYIDKKGKEAVKKGITFDPFLKTKLVGVLATCFLKQPADECKYRKVYDDYKHRLENHPKHADFHRLSGDGPLLLEYRRQPDGTYARKGKALVLPEGMEALENERYLMPDGSVYQKGKTPGHRHIMAMRYMIKIFLQDLWLAWRTLLGLQITSPYNEGVLGHTHHLLEETHREVVCQTI